jgi:hypothetical protein
MPAPPPAPISSFANDLSAEISFTQPPGPRMGGAAVSAFGSAGLSEGMEEEDEDAAPRPSEATVVGRVPDELLAQTRNKTSSGYPVSSAPPQGDSTIVASVPRELIQQSATASGLASANGANGLDEADHAHFKDTYERFIEMRRTCGEPTADLSFDRFVAKLKKNREGLIQKYQCKTVRFQVYQKDGKAALKATPVRA